MSKRIFDTPLAALLPESIRHDAGIAAASQALDPVLRGLVLGVPNLLLFSRLDPNPGQLSPVMQRLTDAASGLNPLSEAELELLAWQFHVDFREVARNPAELAGMVRDSIPWHRIKGTPASIYAALKLFGISARLEEHASPHWATYQLALSTVSLADVSRAYTVAKAMQPVRCRLGRVYTDAYDFRPIRPTAGPKLGEGWLSFFSGVPVEMPDGEDVQVSFGYRHAVESEPFADEGAGAGVGMQAHLALYAPYVDKFIVGLSRIGDEFPRNHGFTFGGLYSGFLGDPEMGGRKWLGGWDKKPWVDTMPQAGTDRKLSPWRMGQRSVSYSQLVLGDGQKLGDDNARLGVSTITLIDNPGRLGTMRLGHNPGRRELRIHKFTQTGVGAELQPVDPAKELVGCLSGALGLTTTNLHAHPDGWSGTWAKRPWWPYVAYGKVGEISLYEELHKVMHTVAPGSTAIPTNLFSE